MQNFKKCPIGKFISVDLAKSLNNNNNTAFFNSCLAGMAHSMTDEEYFDRAYQLMSKPNVFATRSSGWVIESLKWLVVKTTTCQTLNGSSYVETPMSPKGLLMSLLIVRNNKANFCFLFSVAASIYFPSVQQKNPESHREFQTIKSEYLEWIPMRFFGKAPSENRNNVSNIVYQLVNLKLPSLIQ